jgi:biopolymer transport protein ExbD
MIRMPRRSVTRFFIPLIDVLILLFCIFLLMEFNSNSDLDKQIEVSADQSESIDTLLVEVQRRTRELALFEDLRPQLQELANLRKELEELKSNKQKNLQGRTFIRIIDIDGKDGSISFYDESKDKPISNKITDAKSAEALIERHQTEAKGRDLYYVFMPPRENINFPTLGQVRRYRDWFSKAANSLAPLGGVSK